MVILPPRPQGHPIWRSPLFEWGVLVVLVCSVVGALWREAREVQMLAERAAVQSTLGALRTAYVTDFLRQKVQGPLAAGQQYSSEQNPFLLLDHLPPNFAGVVDTSNVAQVPQGSWLFDPACPCIGYRPMYSGDLQPLSEMPVLWFQISSTPGARELKARADYFWAGELVR